MNLNDRIYERLTPEERFRATADAFARLDFSEVDRLQDTCSFVSIRTHAPAYFARVRAFDELAMWQGIQARDQAIAFWAAAFRVRGTEGEKQDEVIARMVNVAANIKALVAAWEDFCKELGVCHGFPTFPYLDESEQLLAMIEDDLPPGEGLEPDAEMYDLWLKTLCETWRKRLDHVRGVEEAEILGLGRNAR